LHFFCPFSCRDGATHNQLIWAAHSIPDLAQTWIGGGRTALLVLRNRSF